MSIRMKRGLSRRISEQFLIFGLAGLFLFTAVSIYLSWMGIYLDSVAYAVCLPLSFLFLGSISLRHASKLFEEIEKQLALIAGNPHEIAELQPLPSDATIARGWNLLIESIQEQHAWNGVERRLSEAVHAQQSQRWEAIFNQLTDGIALCDEEGRFVQVNHALASQLRAESPQALVGKPARECVGRIVDESCRKSLEEIASSHSSEVLELCRSSSQSDGVLRLSIRGLIDESYLSGHSVWVIRDVTQAKLAERAREQFVFTATHELRTPLANIRAYAETLSSVGDIQLSEQQAFYNTINAEATRLARFVDELLDISQLEAGAITIQKHELNLERLANEVLMHQRPIANEKHQKLELAFSPKIPTILADKDKIAAAFTNLVGNAIKYTPNEGQVRIRVESDATRVFLHVEDSGIGISPEDLPKLCTKFFRSADARVQGIGGSGLGLAFTQEVARLHGGSLNVRSELNKGSCFTLELPLV